MALAYRAHERLLRKLLPPQSGTLSFEMGFAGPQFRSKPDRPNWDTDAWSIGPRIKLSDFIAGQWASEGGGADNDVRAIAGYARQSVNCTITRDGRGALIDSGWHAWSHRVTWEPHGDWKPDDWDTEHPSQPFQPPWPWPDCLPWQAEQGFPWCSPLIFPGWWESYTNCLDPSNYGGACPEHDPQNPWDVGCSTCATLGIWGISGFPVGVGFVLIDDGQQLEALAAALANGPTWWRAGAFAAFRYAARLGAGDGVSAAFAEAAARWLLAGQAIPWTDWKVAILSTPAASIQDSVTATTAPGLDAGMLAFDALQAASWTITPYAPPQWTPPNAPPNPPDIPEVLPVAQLNVGALSDWINTRDEPVTARTAATVGWNAAESRNELLFCRPLESEATVQPGQTFALSGWPFRIGDLGLTGPGGATP